MNASQPMVPLIPTSLPFGDINNNNQNLNNNKSSPPPSYNSDVLSKFGELNNNNKSFGNNANINNVRAILKNSILII